MYNPVNVTVQPSSVLKKALYGLLICTVAITLYQTSHALYYSLPVLAAAAWYARKLIRKELPFLKRRHWRLFNDEFELQFHDDASEKLNVLVEYVRPSFVVLKFHRDNAWHWDIVLQKDCEAEPFRQFKAMLKLKQQASSLSK